MHDDTIVQRFIELRAQGMTYARLTTEPNRPSGGTRGELRAHFGAHLK